MDFIIRCIVFISVLMVPASAWAVHPLQVEETNTQGKGNVLFELNGDYFKDHDFKKTEYSGVFTVGAGDYSDITIEVPYLLLSPSPATGERAEGAGDVQLKLKYRTYENEVNQSMGFQVYAGMPTGSAGKGLGTNNVNMGFQVMDQQECHGNILHVSAGYEAYARDLSNWRFDENYAFRYGLAVEHKVGESLRLLTELFGETRKVAHGGTGTPLYANPYTFLAGFKYDIARSWYVDLAGRVGLNRDAEEYSMLGGTAWRF